MKNLILELEKIVGNDYIKENEPMASHCTFKCGGNAYVYVVPGSIDELVDVVNACRKAEAKFIVIGNGSNILIKDEGFDGVIIEVNQRLAQIEVNGNEIEAQAGAKLSAVAVNALKNSLTGLEFAHGIPGNVGGAVVMNAGAYDGEMKDVIKWVKALDKDGNVVTLLNEELELGYRTSKIAKEDMIVLSMCVSLTPGDAEKIDGRMKELIEKRKASQPLEYPSAGSTFKRPTGYFAGKLIDDAGLRGYQVGGAMVSQKHCGFVINYDNATATDVLNVMKDVHDKVMEQFGVELEPEVKIF